jgi:pyruvate,water dikinase
VLGDCERVLAIAAADASLQAALDAYVHVFRRYVGEVSPSLARARQELDRFLRANLGEPLSEHGALLAGLGGLTLERDQWLWELGTDATDAALASLLDRFGDYSPAWDVAVATDRERPDRVRLRAAALRVEASPQERHIAAVTVADHAARGLLDRLPRAARRAFRALLRTVRDVLPIAEDDDWLFYRAQAVARRALLAVAATLPLERAEDVFELPLTAVCARTPGTDWRLLAKTGQQSRKTAARHAPPSVLEHGQAIWIAPRSRDVLRGHATSGRARGRAVVVRALADAPATLPADAVLVAPAIVPALTPLLATARALVTDHGGATSHGATLAREYGVPAVLGARGATTVADGVELYVDGEAGRVYVLG